jgi:hypothetical protein
MIGILLFGFSWFSLFLVQSSGSGSESGTHQTQKSVKSKSIKKSDQDSGSSDENENGSIGLNASDGSSDGSGAQVRRMCNTDNLNIHPRSYPFKNFLTTNDRGRMIELRMCTQMLINGGSA